MDINVIKKLIKKYEIGHTKFIHKAAEGQRYYEGDTDILYKKNIEEETDNPLRSADNRIPTNYQGLLVDQKASYLLAVPPQFDTDDTETNKKILKVLGDGFAKTCKDLCIESANKGIAWLHIWKGEDNSFNYALVPAEQIIPIFSNDLNKKVIAVFRVYMKIDEETGDNYVIYEYWNDKECYTYRRKDNLDIDSGLQEYYMFTTRIVDEGMNTESNTFKHDFGEVPFIPFYNNNIRTNDLKRVKKFIDVYDKVFSGFVNDLDDIQEVIFVLTNYGGEDLKTFLSKLKRNKVVDMQSDGVDDKTALDTIKVDIPVEARREVLEICEKQIFKQGQGVNPNPQEFGNSSGVALQYLYSLLELKAGLTETEFRLGFSKLIRMILNYLNIKADNIKQIWTRNGIRDDSELIDNLSKSKGLIPDEEIIRNHPLIDDPEKAIEEFKQQQQETSIDFDNVPTGGGVDEE